MVAAALLLLFVFGLISNKKKESETTYKPGIKAPITQRTLTGSYSFSGEGTITAAQGVVKNVPVAMNSEGRQVVGYNLIIQYNPATVQVGKITSAISDFTVNQSEINRGFIVIDGNKAPTSTASSVFSNTPVINVPVTVNSAGNFTIRLVEKNGRDESKFYDETVTPYYPAGGVVTVSSQ